MKSRTDIFIFYMVKYLKDLEDSAFFYV